MEFLARFTLFVAITLNAFVSNLSLKWSNILMRPSVKPLWELKLHNESHHFPQ